MYVYVCVCVCKRNYEWLPCTLHSFVEIRSVNRPLTIFMKKTHGLGMKREYRVI